MGTGTTLIIQYWYYVTTDNDGGLATTVGDKIFTISTGTSDNLFHVRLSLNAFGINMATEAASSGVLTVRDPFVKNAWNYVQIKASILESGSFIMKVNGVEVINFSGDVRRGTSTIGSVFIHGHDDVAGVADVIIMDGSGSAFNDFVAPTVIALLLPTADDVTANWTPSSGTRWQAVDDPVGSYDDDATYISSGTAGQKNFCEHASTSPVALSSVQFVGMQVLARSDGVSPDGLTLEIDSAGTIAATAVTTGAGTAYKWYGAYTGTDPNTGLAWDITDVDLAAFGVQATT
jgi:hypothetical protein